MDKRVNFFMWELLAVFFIISYSELSSKIPVDELGTIVSLIFPILWIMLALFSLLMGLIQMRR